MKYKKLGDSELIVSQICIGCMGFGDSKEGHHSWTLNEEESHKIIKSSFLNKVGILKLFLRYLLFHLINFYSLSSG